MQSRPQIIRQFQWIFRFIFDFCWLSCQHVQLSNSTTIKDVISPEYNTHDFSLLRQTLRPLTKQWNSLTSMASVLYTHAKNSSIYIVNDKSFFFSKQDSTIVYYWIEEITWFPLIFTRKFSFAHVNMIWQI